MVGLDDFLQFVVFKRVFAARLVEEVGLGVGVHGAVARQVVGFAVQGAVFIVGRLGWRFAVGRNREDGAARIAAHAVVAIDEVVLVIPCQLAAQGAIGFRLFVFTRRGFVQKGAVFRIVIEDEFVFADNNFLQAVQFVGSGTAGIRLRPAGQAKGVFDERAAFIVHEQDGDGAIRRDACHGVATVGFLGQEQRGGGFAVFAEVGQWLFAGGNIVAKKRRSARLCGEEGQGNKGFLHGDYP